MLLVDLYYAQRSGLSLNALACLQHIYRATPDKLELNQLGNLCELGHAEVVGIVGTLYRMGYIERVSEKNESIESPVRIAPLGVIHCEVLFPKTKTALAA